MDHARTIEKIHKFTEKKKSDKVIKFLSSPEPEIVIAALEALSQIRDEDSVNSIASMIDHAEPKIRIEAARALGSLGTEYAKTYLQHRMAAEQDEEVKKALIESLHTIAENRK